MDYLGFWNRRIGKTRSSAGGLDPTVGIEMENASALCAVKGGMPNRTKREFIPVDS